jgi:hypothetical protein
MTASFSAVIARNEATKQSILSAGTAIVAETDGLTAALRTVSFHQVIRQNPRQLRRAFVTAQLIAEPSGMTGLHQLQKAIDVVARFPSRLQDEKHGIGEVVAEFWISFHLVENGARPGKHAWHAIEAAGKTNKRSGPARPQERNQRSFQRFAAPGAAYDQVGQRLVGNCRIEQRISQARQVEVDVGAPDPDNISSACAGVAGANSALSGGASGRSGGANACSKSHVGSYEALSSPPHVNHRQKPQPVSPGGMIQITLSGRCQQPIKGGKPRRPGAS